MSQERGRTDDKKEQLHYMVPLLVAMAIGPLMGLAHVLSLAIVACATFAYVLARKAWQELKIAHDSHPGNRWNESEADH